MELLKNILHAVVVMAMVVALAPTPTEGNNGRRRGPRPSRRQLSTSSSSSSSSSGDAQVCDVPDTAELDSLLFEATDLPTSFYQLPSLRASVMTLVEFQVEHPHMTKVQHSNINVMSSSQSCDSLHNSTAASFDPCPMLYRFNFDEHRHPSTRVEGHCDTRCQTCSQLAATEGPGIRSTLGCHPVKYYTKVLRRTKNCNPKTGKYIYVKVYEPVTAGCACRTETRRHNSRSTIARNPQDR